MPDVIPQKIAVPTRDETIAKYKRDFSFRAPAGTLTGDGTQPAIDAAAIADTVGPIYADVVLAGDNLVLETSTGAATDVWAKRAGISRELAVGASGYVTISAATTGTTIFAGDQGTSDGGVRLQCTATATYANGGSVPVQCIDTGAGTNLSAGTVITWAAPRSGCSPTCTVTANADGSGLTDGRPVESDADLIARIQQAFSNPPASGNDAEIQQLAAQCPELVIQQPFTYPGIMGGGSTALVFTMPPATPGASRAPNSDQVSVMQAWLGGILPHDFDVFVGDIVAFPTPVAMGVTWAPTSPGWTDVAPWPPYFPLVVMSGSSGIIVKTKIDATHFVVGNTGNYTSIPTPVVGQTIGVYDPTGGVFRRKKILSFTGTGPWTITCDTAENASDTSYVPIVGQRVSPWSDSLDSVVPPVIAYFDALGPGEQLASFFDGGGYLQRRQPPASAKSFPNIIGNKLIAGVLDLGTIDDAELLDPPVPTSTPTPPSPATYSALLTLGDVAVFPET